MRQRDIAIRGLCVILCVMMGCTSQSGTPENTGTKVNVDAPGVNVDVSKKNVKVKAPGVDVQVDLK